MIDPKTAWALAKTTWKILNLLLKCATLIGVIYFALFTDSYIRPFFVTTTDTTGAREANIVFFCCFVVAGFLTLLIAKQLVGILCALFPGGDCCSCGWLRPEALWFRLVYIAAIAILLGTILFGTLYPLVKALAWKRVFAQAERADLEEQAAALMVFMAYTLAVGMLSLLRAAWVLVTQCWEAYTHHKRVGSKEGNNHDTPLDNISTHKDEETG